MAGRRKLTPRQARDSVFPAPAIRPQRSPVINEFRSIAFQPPGGHLFPWLLVGVALAAYSFWVYRQNPAPLTGRLRGLLWGLRALALVLLLGLICRPVLSLGAGPGSRRAVAVLFDTSESLSLPAGADPGGGTRAEAALAALTDLLPRLKGTYGLKLYGFDRHARPLPDDPKVLSQSPGARPSGDVTALGPAIESAVSEIGRARAGALVVVSDGNVNSGLDPLGVSRRLGLPVYAVGVGADSIAHDAAIDRLRINRTAFLGDEVPLAITVGSQGLAGVSAEVVVVDVTRPDQADLITRQIVSLAGGGAEQEVRLKFRPTQVGVHVYEVRLAEQPGEFTLLNNRRLFALDVREDKNRVLLLAGSLNWDVTFLKRVLDADSSLTLTPLARMGGAWRRLDAKRTTAAPPLDAAGLGPLALVVLMDMEASDLPPGAWDNLAAWVRRGGGLLVFGGGRDGGVARLARTPLAGLLPVDPESARPTGQLPLSVALSAAGQRHPVTQIDEDETANAALWTDLPPLSIISSEPLLRGNGEMLVTGADSRWPLLAAGRAGGGKVIVAPASGYWRWDFRLAAYGEKRGFTARLWTNAVRWLTSPDLANRLFVEPDHPVFERGDAVSFSARLSDRDYQPVDGAEIQVRLEPLVRAAGDADTVVVTLTGAAGFYSGGNSSLPPGRYRYRALARLRGEKVGEVFGQVAVETMGAEFRRPAADLDLLRRLAEDTHGAYFAASEVGRLADAIQMPGVTEEEFVTLDIWDSPWFFVLLIGLLSTEWFLRRRRGMV